ncbi:hypothetical protein CFter6_1309 [Collimonas fungivorans]|uniref:Treble clef zinc finger domain-containing protein n=2 Tax=Collimonas fungivorans TaxID=158899 RepID=A0A127P9B3_9BURK|nr:hypothetical protein CFter6_1309 [Collimonas fungivorans]
MAAARGGECLSDTYVNIQSHLLWRCAYGHEWQATPAQIARNHWCPGCQHDKLRTGIDAMRALAAERDGRCLSETYTNSGTYLTWQCERGHIWQATPGTVRIQGSWCQQCHFDSMTKPKQPRKRKLKGPILL